MIYIQNKNDKTMHLFDENYMGHKLIKNVYKSNKYYCDKCKIIVRFDDGLYSYLMDTKIINYYGLLDIICDEMIIKGIIE